MIIRPFKATDLDSVMFIWLSGNLEAHPFVPESYWHKNFSLVKEGILHSEVQVAEIDGTIVGFIGIQDNFVAGLFIDKNHRSQGIGKQLLERAKQHHDSLSLLVYADNIRAFAFYEREGFVSVQHSLDEETGNYEYLMIWPDATNPGLVDSYALDEDE